jgi:hypothetical protein
MDGLAIRRGHGLEGTLFPSFDDFRRYLLSETTQSRHSALAVLSNVNQDSVGATRAFGLNDGSCYFLQGLQGSPAWTH